MRWASSSEISPSAAAPAAHPSGQHACAFVVGDLVVAAPGVNAGSWSSADIAGDIFSRQLGAAMTPARRGKFGSSAVGVSGVAPPSSPASIIMASSVGGDSAAASLLTAAFGAAACRFCSGRAFGGGLRGRCLAVSALRAGPGMSVAFPSCRAMRAMASACSSLSEAGDQRSFFEVVDDRILLRPRLMAGHSARAWGRPTWCRSERTRASLIEELQVAIGRTLGATGSATTAPSFLLRRWQDVARKARRAWPRSRHPCPWVPHPPQRGAIKSLPRSERFLCASKAGLR